VDVRLEWELPEVPARTLDDLRAKLVSRDDVSLALLAPRAVLYEDGRRVETTGRLVVVTEPGVERGRDSGSRWMLSIRTALRDALPDYQLTCFSGPIELLELWRRGICLVEQRPAAPAEEARDADTDADAASASYLAERGPGHVEFSKGDRAALARWLARRGDVRGAYHVRERWIGERHGEQIDELLYLDLVHTPETGDDSLALQWSLDRTNRLPLPAGAVSWAWASPEDLPAIRVAGTPIWEQRIRA
jgi:hypothetical protein